MKNKYSQTTKILLLVFLLIGSIALGQVGIGTTTPDASSMLDIQSSSKGILIPRMTSAQLTTISSPASGLLVFNSDTQSFWFFSGSWTELTSGNGDLLQDTDADTKIEVEQSADGDKIQFTTAGSERMTIDKDGNTRIGNGTNNTFIEADGSLSYEGSATRWDDLKIPIDATSKGSSNAPTYAKYIDNGSGSQGVWIYWFSPTQEQEGYFVLQMPHAWKEGSTLYPHVHWTSNTSQTNKAVTWGLEYTWTNVNGTFQNTTILKNSTPIDGDTGVTANKHYITSLGPISGTNKTLSSMLVCRVFRVASDSSDTYSSNAGLLEIDFHYEIDSDGSRQEYTK